jgi:uncharacterized protein (DUF169 family)
MGVEKYLSWETVSSVASSRRERHTIVKSKDTKQCKSGRRTAGVNKMDGKVSKLIYFRY